MMFSIVPFILGGLNWNVESRNAKYIFHFTLSYEPTALTFVSEVGEDSPDFFLNLLVFPFTLRFPLL